MKGLLLAEIINRKKAITQLIFLMPVFAILFSIINKLDIVYNSNLIYYLYISIFIMRCLNSNFDVAKYLIMPVCIRQIINCRIIINVVMIAIFEIYFSVLLYFGGISLEVIFRSLALTPLMFCVFIVFSAEQYAKIKEYYDVLLLILITVILFVIGIYLSFENIFYLIIFSIIISPIAYLFHLMKSVKILNKNEY